MKTKTYKLEALILFIFLSGAMFGQLTQSKLLNIPVQPNSKSIDFRNPAAITTFTWPINVTNQNYIDFVANGGFIPANAGALDSFYGCDGYGAYCGQAPRYASQNITDVDGNLRYFIMDNYIYDHNGDYFTQLDEDESEFVFTSYDPNVYQANYHGLYHNIIIIPDDLNCEKYFIVYAAQGLDCNTPQVNYGQFTFDKEDGDSYLKIDTLGYGDKGVMLSDCHNNFSMTANNPNGPTDNMLFIVGGAKLTVKNFSDQSIPSIELQLDMVYETTSVVNCNRPDLTITDFGPDKYLLATSVLKPFWDVNAIPFPQWVARNYIALITIPKDFSDISAQTMEQNFIQVGGEYCYGFEFSKNSKYVYYTKESSSSTQIQYLNLTDCFTNYDISQADITSINSLNLTGDYRNSELEMGRDGKLYAVTSTGSITAISNTDNPTAATASYNNFGITCQKMNKMAKYSNDDMSFCFSHQLDGSTYSESLPYNYSSTTINWSVAPYNTATQTWSPGAANNPFGSASGVVYVNSDLVIPTGKYINLQDMEIHFYTGNKLLVNTGSTVRLIRSTLTSNNTCNTPRMWNGVVLNGTYNLDQSTTNQGRLRMDAPSVISNAILGVEVKSGAICYVSSGSFVNNQSSIWFAPYIHPSVPAYNASIIQSADFIINQQLHDGSYPTIQIYLDGVKGININYCDFINSRDLTVNAENRGYAIKSANKTTAFKVKGSTNMSNYITGFNYAVNANQLAGFSLTYMNLNNNNRGLYLTGPTAPIIENNNFNSYDFATSSLYNPSDPNTYPYSCYIYGNGTNTTFTFEGNTVTAEFPALGLYVNNTGTNANEVRDNVFMGTGSGTYDKIYFSCLNLAKNSNYWSGQYDGGIGLQYRCNIFENYNYALSVIDGNIRKYQGIYSGGTTTYAGNGFDRSTAISDGDFSVDQNIVPSSLDLGTYTYYSNADGLVNGYYHKLQYFTTTKISNVVGGQYLIDHCDESTFDGGIIQSIISTSEGSELISEIDNERVLMEYDLAQMIDNGNTNQLLTDVENVNPISDDEVSEKVADAQGFISDEVALTYLENDNANQYAKAEALLANSPLPTNVAEQIENAPIDDNLKSLLMLNQNGINAREIKEMQIGELHQNRSLVVNAMVRGYWDENARDENRAQLKDFLVSDNEILSQQHLFDIYLYENNYNAARECLTKIEDLAYICDMDYIIELENNNIVLRLMMEIEQGNITLDEAVDQNIDLLRAMKSENDVAGSVYAAILLDMAKIEPMTEVIRLPEPAVEQKNAVIDKTSKSNTSFSDMVNIYPNPSSDFVYVEYILTDINNYKSVNLYNASGSLIKSYPVNQKAGYVKIDVNSLSTGTYIVSVGENGGKFSKQIVVE